MSKAAPPCWVATLCPVTGLDLPDPPMVAILVVRVPLVRILSGQIILMQPVYE
jgi:hypothetical protein